MRWTWGVAVALLAALAVLVHHDTAALPTPAMSTMGAMPGMDHASPAAGPVIAPAGHDTAQRITAPATGHGDGACSGPAMTHCSSGDVGTAQLAPPPAAVDAGRYDAAYAVPAGHGPPGVSPRAPPDLSVLSRLLI